MDKNAGAPFRFDRYPWPPLGRIPPGRFVTNFKRVGDGSFRICFLGEDTFTGQPIVLKQFKERHAMQNKCWENDIRVSVIAQRYAVRFNAIMKTSKRIRFIRPIINEWRARERAPFHQGEKALVEPFLGTNFAKFNSNSGWESASHGDSMGAFSHFTYHISRGRTLVCDLQGVRTIHEYILTDPVICSLDQKFGITDLGEDGIRSFFANHKCTSLCEPFWRKHSSPKSYSRVNQHTKYLSWNNLLQHFV